MVEAATPVSPTAHHHPDKKADAGAVLKAALTAEPLTVEGAHVSLANAIVTTEKGWQKLMRDDNTGRDIVEITITDDAIGSSESSKFEAALATSLLAKLHKIPAIRKHAILVSPAQYLTDIKKDMRVLLDEAVKANVEGSKLDLPAWKGVDPAYAGPQVGDFGAHLTEDTSLTTIRLQVATDPKHPDKAMAKANEIAAQIKANLPQIKAGAIARVEEKKYISGIDEAAKKQLEGHTFDVRTQQQDGQWTSVFIEIRSPEQQQIKDHPEVKIDEETLKKSNLFAKITDENSRKKLAGRITLFAGEKFKEPAPYFMDVAGTQDVDVLLIKIMEGLKKKKPELESKIKELLDENVFKRREQWNVPPDQQQVWKHSANVIVNTKEPKTLRVSIDVPEGEGLKIIDQIAHSHLAKTEHAAKPHVAAPAADVAVAEEVLKAAAPAPTAGTVIKQKSALADGITNPEAGVGVKLRQGELGPADLANVLKEVIDKRAPSVGATRE